MFIVFYKSTPYQVGNMFGSYPIFFRFLFNICPLFNRTSNGQQTNNERTKAEVGPYLVPTIPSVDGRQKYMILRIWDGF